MIAALDQVLDQVFGLYAVAPNRNDVRRAAVAVLSRKFRPWRIAFAMHKPLVGGHS